MQHLTNSIIRLSVDTGESIQLLASSVFKHHFNDPAYPAMEGPLRFCSNFMKYVCGKVVMDTKSVSFEQKVKYLFGESGFGIAFEAITLENMMRDILKPNGKEFSLLNLHNNTHKVQTISAQRKVLIRSIADIRALQDGVILEFQ